MTSFSFNLITAAILFPSTLFLGIIVIRFKRFQFPPLFWFGTLSFIYLALEASIDYVALSGGPFAVSVQLHRVSELLVATLIIPLMFMLDRLFRLPAILRRVTHVMMWIAVAFAAGLTIVAFVMPEWFVSLTTPQLANAAAGLPGGARGQYGPAYDARNIFMMIYAPYSLAAMAVAGTRRARLGRAWLITLGTAIIIFTALDDVIQTFTGRYFYLNDYVFARFSMGITIFMLASMIGIMGRFAEYAREIHDATRTLRIHQERLRDFATRDQLTRLRNRDELMTELSQSEHRSLLLIDVDFFRTINDAYGRTRADKLLQEVARRVSARAEASDSVYRVGPDVFALLRPGEESQTELGNRAQEIVTDIRAPSFTDGLSVYLTVSVGAVAAGPGDGADEVMNSAETALDDAKTDRNTARMFTRTMDLEARRVDRIVERLNRAIQHEELSLAYQPIFDRSLRAVSVEALVRWTDEELGTVGPREFIPVAEASGLIVPLTQFVVANTLRDLMRLPANSGITVNVNISRHQLESRRFFDYLNELIDFSRPGDAPITLEVGEDALIRELSNALPALEDLKAQGVRVLLDDFGAGYSSLATLPGLPIHGIKVDPQFIHVGSHSADETSLLRNMVGMAHRLGLSVAAEGIEDQSQLELLQSLEIDFFQGNYLGQPEDFEFAISRGVQQP